jgi:hypothetical protein
MICNLFYAVAQEWLLGAGSAGGSALRLILFQTTLGTPAAKQIADKERGQSRP